ncbi:Rab-GTPase-TBC domain containing protein [Elaphomyces granulatus]|jgi:hypothetical protein
MDNKLQTHFSGEAFQQSVQTEDTHSNATEIKRLGIHQACAISDVNSLVSYAVSEGGLLQDDLRRTAWPILLGSDWHTTKNEHCSSWKDLPRHPDEDQIKLDVNRSFVYYPNCTEKELEGRKQELSGLITEVLRRYPMLCYFQGYHDIAQVMLLVLGSQQAVPALTRVSLFRIRDYMLPSLSPALKHLQLIPSILQKADPRLRKHLSGTQPFFALAATLTLYAHDVQEYGDIARLYDFLLAHEPVVSIYLFTAIILSRKNELFEIPVEEPEMLHSTLSKLPRHLNLEDLIKDTINLFRNYPPESLPFRAWHQIPQYSMLKTSRDLAIRNAAGEAEELFRLQTQTWQREEFRRKALNLIWMYRKPAGSVGFAVVVGLLSFWIRRNGLDASIWKYCINRLKGVF